MIPEELQIIPAFFIQPFLILFQAKATQPHANAPGVITTATGPLRKKNQNMAQQCHTWGLQSDNPVAPTLPSLLNSILWDP